MQSRPRSSTPAQLLADAGRRRTAPGLGSPGTTTPTARPGGERIELSARVLATWTAKAANLLVDDLEVERGDMVALRPAGALADGLLGAGRLAGGRRGQPGRRPRSGGAGHRPADGNRCGTAGRGVAAGPGPALDADRPGPGATCRPGWSTRPPTWPRTRTCSSPTTTPEPDDPALRSAGRSWSAAELLDAARAAGRRAGLAAGRAGRGDRRRRGRRPAGAARRPGAPAARRCWSGPRGPRQRPRTRCAAGSLGRRAGHQRLRPTG